MVGCTFDHRIADAYSANMFLVSWAEVARSNSPLSISPSFRRSILSPRRPPPATDPSLDDLYVTISKLPPPATSPLKVGEEEEKKKKNDKDDMTMISRIFYIQAGELKELQRLASNEGSSENITPSKLESFCSFLWKLISKFSTNGDSSKSGIMMSRMGIVVDGRSRLGNMESYFGNVLSIPFGEKPSDELAEKPLSWVAQEVHQFLHNASNKEHFLGLIDWVEARRPEPNAAKIYFKGRGEEGWPAFVVSSGQRFPVTKVDFGWGKPIFGSYHFPWGGDSGYVMPMPSPHSNGDWVVYMHLSKEQLEFIQSEASHVFRPLTSNYLLL